MAQAILPMTSATTFVLAALPFFVLREYQFENSTRVELVLLEPIILFHHGRDQGHPDTKELFAPSRPVLLSPTGPEGSSRKESHLLNMIVKESRELMLLLFYIRSLIIYSISVYKNKQKVGLERERSFHIPLLRTPFVFGIKHGFVRRRKTLQQPKQRLVAFFLFVLED
jgi:hypothetical protein